MESDASRGKQTPRSACLPRGWPLFPVIAVLPFALATIVLEFVAPTGLQVDLFRGAVTEHSAAEFGHLGDRLNYATLAYV